MNPTYHPVFGQLTFGETVEWCEGSAIWGGRRIPVQISIGRAPTAADLDAAAVAFGALDYEAVVSFAVEQLLDLHNRSWRDSDLAPLTGEAFRAKVDLESVTLYGDGSAEVFFRDGDLFWGHAILVSVNETGMPFEANIAG